MVAYTAIEANTCQVLEAAYNDGWAESGATLGHQSVTPTPLPQDQMPRFLCVKLPLAGTSKLCQPRQPAHFVRGVMWVHSTQQAGPNRVCGPAILTC
jgi:hypothetical protein